MNLTTPSCMIDPNQWHQNIIQQIQSQRQIIKNLHTDINSLPQTKMLLLKGIKQTLKIKLSQVIQQAQQFSYKSTQNNISLKNLPSDKPYITISNKCIKQLNQIQMQSMKKMQELIDRKNMIKKEKKKQFILMSKQQQHKQLLNRRDDDQVHTQTVIIIPNAKMISSVLLESCIINQQPTSRNNSRKDNSIKQATLLEKSYHINNNSISHKGDYSSSMINQSKAQHDSIYNNQLCLMLKPIIKEVRLIHSQNIYLIKTLKHSYKNQLQLNIWLKQIKLTYLSIEVNQKCKSLNISLYKSQSQSQEKKYSQTTATPNQKSNIQNQNVYQNSKKIDKIINNNLSIKKNLLQNKGSVCFSNFSSRQSPKKSSNQQQQQSRIFNNNFNSNSIKNLQSKMFINQSYHPIEEQVVNDKLQQNLKQSIQEGKSKKIPNSQKSTTSKPLYNNNKSGYVLNDYQQNSDSINISNKSRLIDNSSYWRNNSRKSLSNKSSQNCTQIFANNYRQQQQQQQQLNKKQEVKAKRQSQSSQKYRKIQTNKMMMEQLEQNDQLEVGMQEWQIRLRQARRLKSQQQQQQQQQKSNNNNNYLSQNVTTQQQHNFSKKIQNNFNNINETIPTFQSVKIQQQSNNNINHQFSSEQSSNKQNSSIRFNSSYQQQQSQYLSLSQSQSSKLFTNNNNNKQNNCNNQQSPPLSSSHQQSNSFSSSTKPANKIISPLFQNNQSSSSTFSNKSKQNNSSNSIFNNNNNGVNNSNSCSNNPFGIKDDKNYVFNPFQSLAKPKSNTFNQTNVKNPFEAPQVKNPFEAPQVKNPFETPKENSMINGNIFGKKQQNSSSIPNCFQQNSNSNYNNPFPKQEKNPFDKGTNQVFNPFTGDRKSTMQFSSNVQLDQWN